jgi:Mn-containing catalase
LLLELREQAFLFQRALVLLGDRFSRSKQQVENEARDVEDEDKKNGEKRSDNVSTARTNVAKGPDEKRGPKCQSVGDDKGDGKRDPKREILHGNPTVAGEPFDFNRI